MGRGTFKAMVRAMVRDMVKAMVRAIVRVMVRDMVGARLALRESATGTYRACMDTCCGGQLMLAVGLGACADETCRPSRSGIAH